MFDNTIKNQEHNKFYIFGFDLEIVKLMNCWKILRTFGVKLELSKKQEHMNDLVDKYKSLTFVSPN